MNVKLEGRLFVAGKNQLGIDANTTFKNVAWRIATVSPGPKGTLLFQGGIMLAPIFIFQNPPERLTPWWTIGVCQYHTVRPNLASCLMNVWQFMSFENLIGKNPLEATVYPDLRADANGAVGKDVLIRPFEFACGKAAFRAIRRRNNQGRVFLKNGEYALELFEKDALNDTAVDEAYPRINLGDFYKQIASIYTLETEVSKLIANRN